MKSNGICGILKLQKSDGFMHCSVLFCAGTIMSNFELALSEQRKKRRKETDFGSLVNL